METHIVLVLLLTSCSLLISACSEDNSTFESSGDTSTPKNDGLISQNNLTMSFDPEAPKYVDLTTGFVTETTSTITVQIGDNNKQVITANKTIHFRSEWGLIDPSCVTEDGSCTVTWRSTSPDDAPENFLTTIVAFSSEGQETFKDFDDNGLFNDGDTFFDIAEPFVNLNENVDENGNPVFDAGELVIDTINGVDLTGANATHDVGDGLYNGPNCSHTSLCSTTMITSTVWASGALDLTGGDLFTIGGTVSGLTGGTVILQNNGVDDLSVTSDGVFVFSSKIELNDMYNVTVFGDPPGQICTIINDTGTATADVTNVDVTCL